MVCLWCHYQVLVNSPAPGRNSGRFAGILLVFSKAMEGPALRSRKHSVPLMQGAAYHTPSHPATAPLATWAGLSLKAALLGGWVAVGGIALGRRPAVGGGEGVVTIGLPGRGDACSGIR